MHSSQNHALFGYTSVNERGFRFDEVLELGEVELGEVWNLAKWSLAKVELGEVELGEVELWWAATSVPL